MASGLERVGIPGPTAKIESIIDAQQKKGGNAPLLMNCVSSDHESGAQDRALIR